MTRKKDNIIGLVWSGLVWSGLVWSGLVWIIVFLCARFVNTRIIPKCVGGRVSPCPFGAFFMHKTLRRKGRVVTN